MAPEITEQGSQPQSQRPLVAQAAILGHDVWAFRSALNDGFVALDQNGDGEVTQTEVADRVAAGVNGTKIDEEVLNSFRDNFAAVANADRSTHLTWKDDSIDRDDIQVVGDMYGARTEDELLADKARTYLEANFTGLSDYHHPNIVERRALLQGRISNDGVLRSYLLDRFDAVAALDRSNTYGEAWFGAAYLTQADVPKITAQSMTDAKMAELYRGSRGWIHPDFEQYRGGLNAFIADVRRARETH